MATKNTLDLSKVTALVEEYNRVKDEQQELRKAHLAKKAELRAKRNTLDVLVNLGILNAEDLDKEDEDDNENSSE